MTILIGLLDEICAPTQRYSDRQRDDITHNGRLRSVQWLAMINKRTAEEELTNMPIYLFDLS